MMIQQAFYLACYNGHLHVLKYLLKKYKSEFNLSSIDELNGATSLYVATARQFPEVVKFLLESGADPDHCKSYNTTNDILGEDSEYSEDDSEDDDFEEEERGGKGSGGGGKGVDGSSSSSSSNGNKKSNNNNKNNKKGGNSTQNGVGKRKKNEGLGVGTSSLKRRIQQIRNSGIHGHKNEEIEPVESVKEFQLHPFTGACVSGNYSVVKSFMDHKVDLSKLTIPNPFVAAIRKGRTRVVSLILSYPRVDALQRDLAGLDGLYYACMGGRLKLIKLLLHVIERRHGLRTSMDELLRERKELHDEKMTCLQVCVNYGHQDCFDSLIQYLKDNGLEDEKIKELLSETTNTLERFLEKRRILSSPPSSSSRNNGKKSKKKSSNSSNRSSSTNK